MIGDTPYDAEAATGAGTAAAGLLTGGFAREALREAGCFVVASEIVQFCFADGSEGDPNPNPISINKNGPSAGARTRAVLT